MNSEELKQFFANLAEFVKTEPWENPIFFDQGIPRKGFYYARSAHLVANCNVLSLEYCIDRMDDNKKIYRSIKTEILNVEKKQIFFTLLSELIGFIALEEINET